MRKTNGLRDQEALLFHRAPMKAPDQRATKARVIIIILSRSMIAHLTCAYSLL